MHSPQRRRLFFFFFSPRPPLLAHTVFLARAKAFDISRARCKSGPDGSVEITKRNQFAHYLRHRRARIVANFELHVTRVTRSDAVCTPRVIAPNSSLSLCADGSPTSGGHFHGMPIFLRRLLTFSLRRTERRVDGISRTAEIGRRYCCCFLLGSGASVRRRGKC